MVGPKILSCGRQARSAGPAGGLSTNQGPVLGLACYAGCQREPKERTYRAVWPAGKGSPECTPRQAQQDLHARLWALKAQVPVGVVLGHNSASPIAAVAQGRRCVPTGPGGSPWF